MGLIIDEEIRADFHVHTIASVHAYSTIKECAEESIRLEHTLIAITDHFDGTGTNTQIANEVTRFNSLEDRTRGQKGIRILGGVELNLGQTCDSVAKVTKLPLRLGGIHNWYWSVEHHDIMSLQRVTKEYIDRGYINAMAHPERGIEQLLGGKYSDELTPAVREYFDWLVDYSKKKKIFLEANEYSLKTDSSGAIDRMEYWLNLAKDNGNPIILGSDAHYYAEIGKFDCLIALLNKVDYPSELVLNCNPDMMEAIFQRKYT